MKIYNIVLAVTFAAAAVNFVAAQSNKRDASACDAVKGKTYIGWSAGKFDDNPDAAGASRIVFGMDSNASTRSFLSFRPTDPAGTHQLLTATCAPVKKAPNGRTDIVGRGMLAFKIGNIDAGSAYITSYDGGTKVWAESTGPGRPMKGWMLLLPDAPPVADNAVK